MLRVFLLLWTFTVLPAAANYAGDEAASPQLQLKMSELKVNSDLFPGAKSYSAKLTNTTTQTIPIELLQLPPGYSGGGLFYPCAVQFWNGKTKQWRTIPPGNRRSEHTGGGPSFSIVK